MPPIERDDLLPRRPPGMGKGLALAIAAHVLLIVAITFSVNWSSSDPAGVEAELWSAVPQIAAQRAAAEPPEPSPPPKPAPEPKPEPKPEPRVEPKPDPKPAPDPQIAIEKEKKEKEKARKAQEDKLREQQEQARKKDEREKQDREKLKAEQQKREADEKKAEQQKLAEKKKQDAARQAQLDAQRDAQLKRIMSQAGADNGSPSGKGAVTSGPSSTYGGRIRAAVEPNITFFGEINGNPTAEVEVRQSPDGTITGSRLVKSSGVKEWDDAVLRAVDKTQKLPRDIDGRVISPVVIAFRPNQ